MRYCLSLMVFLCAVPASADLISNENIVNGDFTAGLSSWSTSSNTVANWSATTAVPTLGSGQYARTSNVQSGSDQKLFQQFTMPTLVTDATLTWRDRFDSGGINWVDGVHEYRVVVQNAISGPEVEVFSTANNPTVQSAVPTNRGTANDVTAFALANLGQLVRVTFESLDSGTVITASVDNVSFVTAFDTASVPEPSSLLLVSLPFAGAVALRRRRVARRNGEA